MHDLLRFDDALLLSCCVREDGRLYLDQVVKAVFILLLNRSILLTRPLLIYSSFLFLRTNLLLRANL